MIVGDRLLTALALKARSIFNTFFFIRSFLVFCFLLVGFDGAGLAVGALEVHEGLIEHLIDLALLAEALEQVPFAAQLLLVGPAFQGRHVGNCDLFPALNGSICNDLQIATIEDLGTVRMAVVVDEISRPVEAQTYALLVAQVVLDGEAVQGNDALLLHKLAHVCLVPLDFE